ncbi:MAG TPA: hypothetical protein VJ123_05485 [Anaerolineales bacterium]|nr:hypothetical protein [Anaerolineales bacterium]
MNRHTDEGTNGLMIIWAGLFVAGQFGDLATTWWGMHLGLSEMNPAAILVGQERLYLIKIGVIALVPIIAFLAKGISRLNRCGLLGWGGGLGLASAFYNLTVIAAWVAATG